MKKTAIIIGAGPAGLTAAWELLCHTDVKPVIIEAESQPGGLAKTVNFKGNRMDLGPHRFFSKSDKVMEWWQNMLPVDSPEKDISINYHNKQAVVHVVKEPENPEQVMIVKERLTRIFFLGKFFDYPVTLNSKTIRQLGIWRIMKIGAGYFKTKIFPVKPEVTLEDFFINRFGRELYLTFFKDYTEKVWGVPCNQISAAWGAQRIKSLSLFKTIKHAFFKNKKNDISQKGTETSLIEKFLYPKNGAGQMWETAASKIIAGGGEIIYNSEVIKILAEGNRVKAVITNDERELTADYVISSMPVKQLTEAMGTAESRVNTVAKNLEYRELITVGLLLKKLVITNADGTGIKDNWIYMQEKKVKIGRLQIFNNWSNTMVANPDTIWMGLEYFCTEGDEFWNKKDEEIQAFAVQELVSVGMINKEDVLDAHVIKVPKSYPSYTGMYKDFDIVKNYLDTFENLFLIGRNGMHKYNNQDHSMLTAMQAVENIKNGITSKENIWSINTEEEYHEEKK